MLTVVRKADRPGDWDACVAVRRAVFIEEQGVAEHEELDGLDEVCTHFLAEVDGEPLGTARLWVTDQGKAKAQRVAVLDRARGQGLGKKLMRVLEAEASRQGHREVILGAQLTALSFYEDLGYEAYGPVFDDAGIDHRMMKKKLG